MKFLIFLKAAVDVGINTELIEKDTISEDDLVELIERLNMDSEVDGILVQLPLPGHIDERKVSLLFFHIFSN